MDVRAPVKPVRRKYQHRLQFDDFLFVDNFAGGGGASEGIKQAIGRSVDIAVNHCMDAISMHRVNNPGTHHHCESIWDVVPREVCGMKHVRGAWFSPDCTHHSKAKGDKPVQKKIRGLAWAAVYWAEEVRPDVIFLENVEEFRKWGPINRITQRPIKEKAGITFDLFVWKLKQLGYELQWKELVACDYGAPTSRKRLFMVARCDGNAIKWPSPTHCAPERVKSTGLKPWRSAKEIINWSLPCPSIDATSEQIMRQYGIPSKRPLRPATIGRINEGVRRFILESGELFNVPGKRNTTAFIFKYYGNGGWCSLNQPLATITVNDRFALVQVKLGRKRQVQDIGMRMLSPRELFNAQGFPPDYVIDIGEDGRKVNKKVQVARCGNAVPPQFSKALVKANL